MFQNVPFGFVLPNVHACLTNRDISRQFATFPDIERGRTGATGGPWVRFVRFALFVLKHDKPRHSTTFRDIELLSFCHALGR
jgi:hypothetical protein